MRWGSINNMYVPEVYCGGGDGAGEGAGDEGAGDV